MNRIVAANETAEVLGSGGLPVYATPSMICHMELASFKLAEQYGCYIDDRSEKIGRKIRDNELKHTPYLLVVGEKEQVLLPMPQVKLL